MKIAIIGAGAIAEKTYFPMLTNWPGLEIVSLFSRTQASVDKACEKWRIGNGTTDLHTVLKANPQAVFVVTNNASHYDLCKFMLENGMDVYVEKPLAISSMQCFDLAQIAEKHQRVLAVGFNRRYALLYRQAKEIFQDRPIQSAVFQKHRISSSHINLYNQYLDDTIHQIDLMRYYCGELEVLSTHYQMIDNQLAGAISTARMQSGGLAVLINSLQAGAWQESVTLHGEGLTVHVDAFRELRVKYNDREEVYGADRAGNWISDMRERGVEGEIKHFLECVKNRQTPLTSALEAAKTQELMEKLVEISGDKLELPKGDWDRVNRWVGNKKQP